MWDCDGCDSILENICFKITRNKSPSVKEATIMMTTNGKFLVIGIVLVVLSAVINQGGAPKLVDPTSKVGSDDHSLSECVLLDDPLLRQGAYSGLTEPSFETRENVDFLLTPGILVQEAITEGLILIYPEE